MKRIPMNLRRAQLLWTGRVLGQREDKAHMNVIFRAYASFATIGLSERKWKNFLRTAYGRGATRTQNVAISEARMRNVRV